MEHIEIRDLKNKLNQISSDHLAEFLKINVSPEVLQRLMMLESDSNYKGTSYDEYIAQELPWMSCDMKELSLMSQKHNDFLPTDLLPCALPKEIIKYKDSIYFIFISNGSIEVRFKLPAHTNEYFYDKNSKWKVNKDTPVKYRQQVLMGYTKINGNCYFFLRGYGSKEFNRYAISVYCPDKNALWGTPHYCEILTMYKEILANPNIKTFRYNLQDVISGSHPRSVENDELFSWQFSFNRDYVKCKYQIFLYFTFYLTIAEDHGMYSREYAKVGFKSIEDGKTIYEAQEEQIKFRNRAYVAIQDKEINEIIEEYKRMYEYMDDKDATMSRILSRLYSKEKSDLKALYSRMYFRYKSKWQGGDYKGEDLEYEKMIVAITDTLYKVLFDSDGKLNK